MPGHDNFVAIFPSRPAAPMVAANPMIGPSMPGALSGTFGPVTAPHA
jgi:hypothetical protein